MNRDPRTVDFVVGGVKVGEYLKKSGRSGNIAMVASIVAAIASVAAVIFR